MKSSITFGSQVISFHVSHSNRKSLGISVNPDMTVSVKAPIEATTDRIKQTIRKKAPWILKQQQFFLAFHPKSAARRFVSGETHLYLGKQYRLKITSGKNASVKLKGKFLHVITPDKSQTETLVNKWYLEKAHEKFHQLADPLIARFTKHKVKPQSIVLRNMSTRWGSCTPKGKIILNPELIKTPKGCIEYVIIHELCHLVHHDHTQKFIDLQKKEMPDWEQWKGKLERLMA